MFNLLVKFGVRGNKVAIVKNKVNKYKFVCLLFGFINLFK